MGNWSSHAGTVHCSNTLARGLMIIVAQKYPLVGIFTTPLKNCAVNKIILYDDFYNTHALDNTFNLVEKKTE